MPQSVKIATCCYCGTRAALVLDKVRHELSCRACGAPLHEMKMMPRREEHLSRCLAAPAAASIRAASKSSAKYRPKERYDPPRKRRGRKPRKELKRFGKKVFEELWDVVEDIFD